MQNDTRPQNWNQKHNGGHYLTIPTPPRGWDALIKVWIMIFIFMVISHCPTKALDQEGSFNIYRHWSSGTVISINGRSISHMGWLKSPETCYLCGRLYELCNWMYIARCCRRIPPCSATARLCLLILCRGSFSWRKQKIVSEEAQGQRGRGQGGLKIICATNLHLKCHRRDLITAISRGLKWLFSVDLYPFLLFF